MVYDKTVSLKESGKRLGENVLTIAKDLEEVEKMS